MFSIFKSKKVNGDDPDINFNLGVSYFNGAGLYA